MDIFVLSFRVHLISCILLCALRSLHKLNIKQKVRMNGELVQWSEPYVNFYLVLPFSLVPMTPPA